MTPQGRKDSSVETSQRDSRKEGQQASKVSKQERTAGKTRKGRQLSGQDETSSNGN